MEKIMIVDDEPEQLRSLRVGLKSRGYSILDARSAEEALALLNGPSSEIDLVITDYLMPGMDGVAFLEKKEEMGNQAPSIMMTAHGEKSLLIRALRCGCSGFIEKPFTLDELIGEIKRVRRRTSGNGHPKK